MAAAVATPPTASLEVLLEAKRYVEFFKEAHLSAQRGNADAQFLLGKAYHLGKGVAVQLDKAQEYYNLAAAQGHARAEHNLGNIALDPPYDRPDVALDHFSKARALGLESPTVYNMGRAHKSLCIRHESEESCTAAGEAYSTAWRVDQRSDSLDEAVYSFVQACLIERSKLTNYNSNPLPANFELKRCKEATDWAEKGAAAGLARSAYNRGAIDFFAKRYGEALPWFRLADERGLGLASYTLGEMHQEGMGVAPDKTEATKWFKRSAALKHEKGVELVRTILHTEMTASHEPARIHAAIAEWASLEPVMALPHEALNRLRVIEAVKENTTRFPPLAQAANTSFQARFCPGRNKEMGWNTLWLEWNSLWRIFAVTKPEDSIHPAHSLKLLASGMADKKGCLTLSPESQSTLRETLARGETLMLNWPGQRHLLSVDRLPNGQLALKLRLQVGY